MNRARRRALALAGAGAALLTACEQGGGTRAPSAPGVVEPPTPPAPPPIVAVVSFEDTSAEVYEGDTASLAIRYEARDLDTPWRLRVSPLPGAAQSADFSLPNAVVEIPAGQGTTGTVTLDFTALPDDEFDEGTETLSLRFVPDPAVNAELGDDLPVSIREGGALVSFASGRPDTPPLEVAEGGAVEVPIFYEIRNLTAPLDLSPLSILGETETAESADFRLEESAFTLPAGRGITGNASARLSAEEDNRFAEGDETGLIRLLPIGARTVGVRLGDDARFVIRDRAVSPCPGVSVRAAPPSPDPGNEWNDHHLSTTLTVTQDESAAEAVLFQRSPYWLTDWMRDDGWRPPPAFTFADWRMEPEGGVIQHSVALRWPSGELLVRPQLEFGFLGGGCSGEAIATCTADGCELIASDSGASAGR